MGWPLAGYSGHLSRFLASSPLVVGLINPPFGSWSSCGVAAKCLHQHSTRSCFLFLFFLVGNTGSAFWDMHGMHACYGREDTIGMIFVFAPDGVFKVLSSLFWITTNLAAWQQPPSRKRKKNTKTTPFPSGLMLASTRSLGIRYLFSTDYHHNQTIPEVTHSKKKRTSINMM